MLAVVLNGGAVLVDICFYSCEFVYKVGSHCCVLNQVVHSGLLGLKLSGHKLNAIAIRCQVKVVYAVAAFGFLYFVHTSRWR
jgi:hypothetical protein